MQTKERPQTLLLSRTQLRTSSSQAFPIPKYQGWRAGPTEHHRLTSIAVLARAASAAFGRDLYRNITDPVSLPGFGGRPTKRNCGRVNVIAFDVTSSVSGSITIFGVASWWIKPSFADCACSTAVSRFET